MKRPSFVLRIAAASGAALALAAVACTSSQPASQDGLMVIVDTNMASSEYDAIRVQVSQEIGGAWHSWLDTSKSAPAEVVLPTTVFVEAGKSPDQEVDVRVTAYLGGVPVVLREAQLQAPTDRIAALSFVLAESCKGKVSAAGSEGSPASTCDPGESCQPATGQCGSNVVVTSSLPTFTPGASLGGFAVFDAGGVDATASSPDAASDAEDAPDAGDDASNQATPSGLIDSSVDSGTASPDDAGSDAGDDTGVASIPDADDETEAAPAPGDAGADSEAGPTCTDACANGSAQCATGTAVQSCVLVGACRQWGPATACKAGLTCQGGACACPASTPATCGSQCVDLTTDGANCGLCGHGCQGGSCSGSKCQPITLASGRTGPWTVAVNASGVYWLEPSAVMAIPLGGGTVVTLAPSAYVTNPAGISADASYVYYSNNGSALNITNYNNAVMRVSAAGGGNPAEFAKSSSNISDPGTVVVSAGVVYWADHQWLSIFKAPESSGTVSTLYDGSGAQFGAHYSLTVDSTNAYFGGTGGEVVQAPLSGAATTTLQAASGAAQPIQMATAQGYVYWSTTGGEPSLPSATTPSNSTIYRVPIGGGTVTQVVSGLSVTGAMAADASGFYWDDGDLKRQPNGGGAVVTIASGQNAGSIALDATTIYWTNASTGTVSKIAK